MKLFILVIIICYSMSSLIFSQILNEEQIDSTKCKISKRVERYIQATVEESGRLLIKTSNSKEFFIQKDSGQVGFDKIAISNDGQSVGWLSLYNNSATSYPIPLELKVLSGGDIHLFKGNGLPIWQWYFSEDGKQVAFEQETVHGGLGIHYELREIATDRLIDFFEPEYGKDNQLLEIQKNVPKWVKEFNIKH